MIKIKSAHLKSYTAAQFVAFYMALDELFGKYKTADLHLDDAFIAKFRSHLNLLKDAVNATQGSDKTALIASYDAERDKHFRFIRNVLSNLKNATDADLAALYETVQAKLLKVYPSTIATEANQEETAHIAGFLLDIRQFISAENITKIGISEAMTALEAANNNFQKTFLTRSNELAQTVEAATQKYRAVLENLYAQMETKVNYGASLTEASDEADIKWCNTCQTFIGDLNQYIDELWQSIKLGKALSKDDKENTGGNGGNGGSNGGSNSGGNSNGGGNSGGGSSSGGSGVNLD